MEYKKIQFTYCQHINSNVTTAWEKHIFEETYNEFLIQSAVFQPEDVKLDSFKELLKHNNSAFQLNSLLTTRIVPSVELLQKNIFSVPDNLNTNYLQFVYFNVSIIQSSITDKKKHYITINYVSKPYYLIDCINNYYLITTEIADKSIIETQMLSCQKNLSISAIHL